MIPANLKTDPPKGYQLSEGRKTIMKLTASALRLLILILLCGGLVHPQEPCPLDSASTFTTGNSTDKTLLLVADNQEHNLMGVQLKETGAAYDRWATNVAMRTPLSHVGGRLLLRRVLLFGREQKADLVLHLGDAANVSCPDELWSVFNLLDKQAGHNWFMAPGNHDGIRIGTFAKHQPAWNESVPADYSRPIEKGMDHQARSWFNACQAPTSLQGKVHNKLNVKGILTKGDATMLYAAKLKKRGADVTALQSAPVNVEGIRVTCKVEQLDLENHGYTAITQICPAVKVKPKSKKWVGPYASYIIQKLEIHGTRIIMLDTSNYFSPSAYNVAMKGELTTDQRKRVQKWFDGVDRRNVVVIGHHPIDDFPEDQQQWIVKRAARYISGHVHRSTQLIKHKSGGDRTLELNVASTVDYPSQAVLAKVHSPTSMSFEVTGAGASSPGFIKTCIENTYRWKLKPGIYKDYRRGVYVNRLLESLTEAALRHIKEVGPLRPNFQIPKRDDPGGWHALETVLQRINAAEDETSRTFWACQAHYASDETQGRSVWEWLMKGVRRETRSGCDATRSRFNFSAL